MTTTSRRRLRKAPLLFAAAISALLLTAGLAAAGAPALAAPAAPAAAAATVSAMAPGMMAVHGATAVPVDQTTKAQVSPDFTCESGYGGWYVHTDSTNFWLWIGTDESSYVVTDTTDGSCWHAPDSNDTGQIKNEAGDCLEWHASTGVNLMATCADIPSQEWITEPTGDGSDYFENIYGYDHANSGSGAFLNQYAPEEDSVTNLGFLTTGVDPAEAWIHADCSSSC